MKNFYDILQSFLCSIGIHNFDIYTAKNLSTSPNQEQYTHYKICKHCEFSKKA